MSYPWFKIYADLPDHPKVMALDFELRTLTRQMMSAGTDPASVERTTAVTSSATTFPSLVYLLKLWCKVVRFWPAGDIESPNPVIVVEQACGWDGPPGELFAALVKCQFIQQVKGGIRIRNWSIYNGPHIEKAKRDAIRKREQRADAAAAARIASADSTGESQNETRIENEIKKKTKKKKQNEIESALESGSWPQPEDLQALWNSLKAPEQPIWQEITKQRRKQTLDRLKERPLRGDGSWEEVFKRLAASSFARGLTGTKDGKGWVAGPTFFLRPDSAAKVLEGTYDDRTLTKTKTRLRVEDVPQDAFAKTGDFTHEL